MDVQVTPTFNRIKDRKERVVFLRGGARSGKSFALMQKAVLWLYTGQISGEYVPEGTFTIVRLTFPALRATVYKDFVEYLFELGIYSFMDHKKTIHEIHCGKRSVCFIPADSEQKLRGRKHTFAWLEEVNDLPYDVFHQISIRTERQIFMSVNPSGHPWARTEIEEKRMIEVGDVHLDVSTYHDNPFLDQNIRTEIENLKYTDEGLYRIYSLGEWTELKGLIFPNVTITDRIPPGREFYGLDFGWNDPSVCMRVVQDGMDLYLDCILYERELTLDLLADSIKQDVGRSKLYCDSAEPRSIEELRRRGLRARKAKKGPDSIRQGLTFLRQHRIHVTSRSVETLKEFEMYKWEEDKEGNMTDKPIAMFDHSADAARYAVTSILGTRIKFI